MILDASALLALLLNEPGAQLVRQYLRGSAISSVNLAEVATLYVRRGVGAAEANSRLAVLPIRVTAFSKQQALLAAELVPLAGPLGLSLADRACLALGLDRNEPVMTADRVWAQLDLPVKVTVIR
jgi:PIN domain nuclease of toxin-antitoxin system